MLPLFTKRKKTTLSFATYCKVARRSIKFAARVLAYVHRFVDIARRTAVPNSSLTVQDLKRSEFKLLKWSQLHLDVSQIDEKLIATTNEEGLIRTHGRLENSRTLRLKESYARSKANALDYWAQENGQVRGQQMGRLSDTAQETPTTA